MTQETDKEMQDVEHLLAEATETEEEIKKVLELNRSHRESFESMWHHIQWEVGLRQELLETSNLGTDLATLAALCEGNTLEFISNFLSLGSTMIQNSRVVTLCVISMRFFYKHSFAFM